MSEKTTETGKQIITDEEEQMEEEEKLARKKRLVKAKEAATQDTGPLKPTMDVVSGEVEELQVAVPSFRLLDKVLLEWKEYFDTSLPHIQPCVEVSVPPFRPLQPVVLRETMSFDLESPKIESATPSLHAPRFAPMGAPSLSIRDDFDAQCVELRRPPQVVIKEKRKETDVTKEVEGEGGSVSEGLLDRLFETGDGAGDASLSQGGPLVIILSKPEDDDCEGTLRIILREIYQERHGGYPKPTIVSIEGKEKIEDELKADRAIVLVDDRKSRYFGNWTKGTDIIVKEKLRDRLLESFSQRMGFVVFYVPENLSKYLEIELRKLLRTKGPTIMNLRMNALTKEQKLRLSTMIWGFVDPEEGPNLNTLDDFFFPGDRKFNNTLTRIAKKYKAYVRPNDSDDPSREGAIHLLLKQFVVGYLIKKLNLPPNAKVKDHITTEEPLVHPDTGRVIRPDVFVKSERTAYEVETLHGVGVLDKIAETVSKYEGTGCKVNIVMKNITLLRHIMELRRKKGIMKKEHGVDVDFFGVDLKNRTLIPLNSFRESTRSLFQKRGKSDLEAAGKLKKEEINGLAERDSSI